MFRYLIAISLLISMSAHADGIAVAKKQQECSQKAWLAETAVMVRDSGLSPQEALKFAKSNHPNPLVLDEGYMKRAINDIYFDSRLQGIPGGILSQQIVQMCLYPAPDFQPLR
jgi:hypothetical protein